jgi:hypothetical protein
MAAESKNAASLFPSGTRRVPTTRNNPGVPTVPPTYQRPTARTATVWVGSSPRDTIPGIWGLVGDEPPSTVLGNIAECIRVGAVY